MLARTLFRAPGLTSSLTKRAFSVSAPRPLAKISLIGHLAASPELTATSTGHEIVKYSLATSSGPKDNRHTSWWRVTAFIEAGARRDFVLGLDKGTLLYVEGDAKMETWEGAEGEKRSGLGIVHRNVEILKRPQHDE